MTYKYHNSLDKLLRNVNLKVFKYGKINWIKPNLESDNSPMMNNMLASHHPCVVYFFSFHVLIGMLCIIAILSQ